MIRVKQVDESKEIGEIGDLQVLLVAKIKHGIDSGMSLAEIIAAVGASVVEPLITAIQGMDQVDEEWKQNRLASLNAIFLSSAKTLDLLLPAQVVPTPGE